MDNQSNTGERALVERAAREAMKIPLERAEAARIEAKRVGNNAEAQQQVQMRAVPAAPADLLGIRLNASPGGNDAAGEMVAAALKLLHQEWSDLREVANERDRLGTAYVNPIDQLHTLGTKRLEAQLDNLSRVQRELVTRTDQAQRDLDAAVMIKVDPPLAQDIRQAFVAKKGQVLDDIVRDQRVASAVLSAPLLVLGVDQAKVDTFRDLAERTHAADKRARVEHLKRLAKQTATAVGLVRERLEPAIGRWTPRAQSAALKRLGG